MSNEKEKPSVQPPRKPGDEATPGTPGAGENYCHVCEGSGTHEGKPCQTCGGTGIIVEGIGGA